MAGRTVRRDTVLVALAAGGVFYAGAWVGGLRHTTHYAAPNGAVLVPASVNSVLVVPPPPPGGPTTWTAVRPADRTARLAAAGGLAVGTAVGFRLLPTWAVATAAGGLFVATVGGAAWGRWPVPLAAASGFGCGVLLGGGAAVPQRPRGPWVLAVRPGVRQVALAAMGVIGVASAHSAHRVAAEWLTPPPAAGRLATAHLLALSLGLVVGAVAGLGWPGRSRRTRRPERLDSPGRPADTGVPDPSPPRVPR